MASPPSLTEPDLALEALCALVAGPVPPGPRPLREAVGCWLAQDLVTPAPIPAAATATRGSSCTSTGRRDPLNHIGTRASGVGNRTTRHDTTGCRDSRAMP